MDFEAELDAYAARLGRFLSARVGRTALCSPDQLLAIDGRERRDVSLDVVSLTLRDSVTELSGVDLVLRNWDDGGPRGVPGFTYSRDPREVALGRRIDLRLGYRDEPGMMRAFVGEITALEPRFAAEGGTTIVVRALDRLHRLRNAPRSKAWKDVTDEEIAREIAARGRFAGAAVDRTVERFALVPQHNMDDLAFLLERARRIGFELFVRDDVLRFTRPRDAEAPRIRLSWESDILSFHPAMTLARQVSRATVRCFDPGRGEIIRGSAGPGALEAISHGRRSAARVLEEALGEPKEEVIVTEALASEQDAEAMAEAMLLDASHAFITGRAETIGIPALRAGTTVGFDGFGPTFDGDYYITASTHRIDTRGYRTMISVRKVYAS